MSEGIKSSTYFIICISRQSANSPWVNFETKVALQNNKTVIAVLLSTKDKSVILDNPFLNAALQGGQLKVMDFESLSENIMRDCIVFAA
jgi:hypothetical protein